MVGVESHRVWRGASERLVSTNPDGSLGGEGLDTGTPAGWIAANAVMASRDGRLAGAFADAVEAMAGIAGFVRA